MSEEKKVSRAKASIQTAPADRAGKLQALQSVMEHIEKAHGKGAIMNLGAQPVEPISVIPSGSVGLDLALGVGGYPRGRIIEIYGQESSGKTTLAIHAIAEVQKLGGVAAIIDAEHAFDPSYAQKLGVDVNALYISQPDHGEQALDIAEQLIRSSAVDLIVIDSVAALTPKAEIEGEMGESKMGLHARLMSQAMRKITGAINRSNTTCIFINQVREKIGGTGYGMGAGVQEVTTGGNALKFYASVRIEVRKGGQLKEDDDVFGYVHRTRVVKNKVAPPFRRAAFDIIFGQGISRIGEIVDLGCELNIIKKSGSWFSYGDIKLGQGRENAKAYFEANPEVAEEVVEKIIALDKGTESTNG